MASKGLAMCLAAVLVAAVLSGCAEDAGVDAAVEPEPEPEVAPPVLAVEPDPVLVAPQPVVIPVNWQGNLGTWAYGCQFAVGGNCRAATVADASADHFIDGQTGVILAANLTMTWTAPTPLTETLLLGVMSTTLGCGDCNASALASTTGVSPLQLVAQGNATVEAGASIRVYAYNLEGHRSQPPLFVGSSLDQEFSVTGDITVLRG